MAAFKALSGKLTFRMDSGEVRDGKVVYRSMSIGSVDGSSAAGDVAAVAEAVAGLIELSVDRVSLTRVDVVEF
jgi:mevalonate pyrophosphate decarboxylase